MKFRIYKLVMCFEEINFLKWMLLLPFLALVFSCADGFIVTPSSASMMNIRQTQVHSISISRATRASQILKPEFLFPRSSLPDLARSSMITNQCSKTGYVGETTPLGSNIDAVLNDIAWVRDDCGKRIQCFVDQLLSIDNQVLIIRISKLF